MAKNGKWLIQEVSIDAKTLYDILKAVPAGELVPYGRLSAAIERDVQAVARSALTTARRMALRDDRIAFGVVRTQGLRRLIDTEKVAAGEDGLSRIRRTARRTVQLVTSVDDFDSLPNDSKVKHNTVLSLFGAMRALASPRRRAAIEKQVASAQSQLPLAKTLKLFSQ